MSNHSTAEAHRVTRCCNSKMYSRKHAACKQMPSYYPSNLLVDCMHSLLLERWLVQT
jgi:hypothetical protein